MKDAVFGSLAAWIKADNFEGKQRFINEQQGLDWLTSLFCQAAEGGQAFNMRLKKKILNLINDLVVNDDGIFEEHPYTVRQHFSSSQAFMSNLAAILTGADLLNMQELQYRDSALRIIFRLHQYRADVLGSQIVPVLY